MAKIDFPDAPDPTPDAAEAARAAPPTRRRHEDAPAAAADEDASTDEDRRPAPRRARPASSGSTPGHFEPTEKVRADFDVSFPVDI